MSKQENLHEAFPCVRRWVRYIALGDEGENGEIFNYCNLHTLQALDDLTNKKAKITEEQAAPVADLIYGRVKAFFENRPSSRSQQSNPLTQLELLQIATFINTAQ
jgi:hypothetical protein